MPIEIISKLQQLGAGIFKLMDVVDLDPDVDTDGHVLTGDGAGNVGMEPPSAHNHNAIGPPGQGEVGPQGEPGPPGAAGGGAGHDAVTVSGSPDYITLSGQDIVRAQIVLTTDVTGVLPEANLPNASTSAEGVVELATAAEVTSAATGNKVITSEALGDSDYGERIIGFLVSDPNGDALTTGTFKATARIPSSMDLMELKEANAHVTTVSSSGAITIQIVRSRRTNATTRALVDMLQTEIDIDQGEFDSLDGASEVINSSNDDVNTGDHIHIDVDAAGASAKGLFVELIFRVP